MIEGTDYCFIYPKDDNNIVHIRILSGQYNDTVFKYGKVKFEEKNDGLHLIFALDVLECPLMKPKNLEKDNDFIQFAGNLLAELMGANLDQEMIDENRIDDSEESGLQ